MGRHRANIEEKLSEELAQLRSQTLYRQMITLDSPQGASVRDDSGNEFINFCSNDYLGLANNKDIAAKIAKAAENLGAGTASSHLLAGHNQVHEDLQQDLARYLGYSRVLLFSSGYQANMAVLTTLADNDTLICLDKLVHASIIDGTLLACARNRSCYKRYANRDVRALEKLLANRDQQSAIVYTDGVFSMDGTVAPLQEMQELCNRYEAMLCVDDAHGFGVLGRNGKGTAAYLGLKDAEIPLLMATFGKAIGMGGAFVAASENVAEMMIQRARNFIYTTAMPLPIVAGIREAVSIMRNQCWRRQHLHELIAYFRKSILSTPWNVIDSETPIQGIIIGDNKRLIDIHAGLKNAGFLVGAIRTPTVPNQTERLRISLTADHEKEHVEELLDALAKLI